MKEIKKDVYQIEGNQYLKKFKGGWTIISPIKKDITKPLAINNIDWFNMITGGSIANLIKVLIILFLLVGISWSYASETKMYREMISNPVTACMNAGYIGFQEQAGGEKKEDEFRLYLPSSTEDDEKAFSE